MSSPYAEPVTRTKGARPPGRPSAATQEDVLRAAAAVFLDGRRVDVNAIATGLGVGRASVYRWFGSRDGLLGAAIAHQLERTVAYAGRHSAGTGARRLNEI